ncbi:argininosuccinate lyase [Diaporthe helianthi]|uniref:Argininosuccinate lyase n=1 Tax=Diaporthe helianthi TaxID=158607 RepID=A0A2P5HWE4_DIAHE|nr:argininosuccinate lyase [Diaporthe helianthi]
MAGIMMVSPPIKGDQERIENLQEGWEPILDSVQTVSDSLGIADGVIATLKVRPERMEAALDKTMLATDVVEWLVRRGCPFREAHRISGPVVAQSEKLEVSMDKLTLEQVQAIDSRFTADVAEAFDYETSVEAKTSKGGASRSSVLEQIQILRLELDPGIGYSSVLVALVDSTPVVLEALSPFVIFVAGRLSKIPGLIVTDHRILNCVHSVCVGDEKICIILTQEIPVLSQEYRLVKLGEVDLVPKFPYHHLVIDESLNEKPLPAEV